MRELEDFLHARELLASAWRRRHGATANEQLVIVLLATRGARTPKDLSDFVGVTTGGMSTLLDRLEARGFVRRTAKEDDRRRVLVTLTKAGLRAHLDLEDAVDEVHLLADVDPALHDTVRALFATAAERVATRASELGAKPPA